MKGPHLDNTGADCRIDSDHDACDVCNAEGERLKEQKERASLLKWFAKADLGEYSTEALSAAYRALTESE